MSDYDTTSSLEALAQDVLDRLALYRSGSLTALDVWKAIQSLWAQGMVRLFR